MKLLTTVAMVALLASPALSEVPAVQFSTSYEEYQQRQAKKSMQKAVRLEKKRAEAIKKLKKDVEIKDRGHRIQIRNAKQEALKALKSQPPRHKVVTKDPHYPICLPSSKPAYLSYTNTTGTAITPLRKACMAACEYEAEQMKKRFEKLSGFKTASLSCSF